MLKIENIHNYIGKMQKSKYPMYAATQCVDYKKPSPRIRFAFAVCNMLYNKDTEALSKLAQIIQHYHTQHINTYEARQKARYVVLTCLRETFKENDVIDKETFRSTIANTINSHKIKGTSLDKDSIKVKIFNMDLTRANLRQLYYYRNTIGLVFKDKETMLVSELMHYIEKRGIQRVGRKKGCVDVYNDPLLSKYFNMQYEV